MYTLSEDNSEIVVDKTSENRNYDDFVHDLPSTECRWVVYDFQDERAGVNRNKIVFISW
jgi:cofilin